MRPVRTYARARRPAWRAPDRPTPESSGSPSDSLSDPPCVRGAVLSFTAFIARTAIASAISQCTGRIAAPAAQRT
jgi:hypothetical protein